MAHIIICVRARAAATVKNYVDQGLRFVQGQTMKLNKFIRRPGKSAQYLAEACDVNLVTAYRWVNGDSIPTPANMARIQKYTRGHVKPADFYTTDDEEEAS